MGLPFGVFRTFSVVFFSLSKLPGVGKGVSHPQIPHPFQEDSASKEAMELAAPMGYVEIRIQ